MQKPADAFMLLYFSCVVFQHLNFAYGFILHIDAILAGSLHREIDRKDDSSEPISGEKPGAQQILSKIVQIHAGPMLAFAGFLRRPLEDVSP